MECTKDGSVDLKGNPAIRETSGKWVAGIIILCKLLFLNKLVILFLKKKNTHFLK